MKIKLFRDKNTNFVYFCETGKIATVNYLEEIGEPFQPISTQAKEIEEVGLEVEITDLKNLNFELFNEAPKLSKKVDLKNLVITRIAHTNYFQTAAYQKKYAWLKELEIETKPVIDKLSTNLNIVENGKYCGHTHMIVFNDMRKIEYKDPLINVIDKMHRFDIKDIKYVITFQTGSDAKVRDLDIYKNDLDLVNILEQVHLEADKLVEEL